MTMALPAIIDRKVTNVNPMGYAYKNDGKEFRLPKIKNDSSQLKNLHHNFPYQVSRKQQLIDDQSLSVRRPDGTIGINPNFRSQIKKPAHLNPLTRSIENIYNPRQDDGQLRPSHHKLSVSITK